MSHGENNNAKSTVGFELLTSQLVDFVVSNQHAELQTNPEALHLLADAVEVTLPEHPRVVLLGAAQVPHTEDTTVLFSNRGWVPKVQDGDIVLNLNTDRPPLKQEDITEGIATQLAKWNLAERNRRGQRASIATFLTGLGMDGVHYFGYVGGGLLNYGSLGVVTAGIGGLAYFSNRERVRLPEDIHDMPPIRLVPRTDSQIT